MRPFGVITSSMRSLVCVPYSAADLLCEFRTLGTTTQVFRQDLKGRKNSITKMFYGASLVSEQFRVLFLYVVCGY